MFEITETVKNYLAERRRLDLDVESWNNDRLLPDMELIPLKMVRVSNPKTGTIREYSTPSISVMWEVFEPLEEDLKAGVFN